MDRRNLLKGLLALPFAPLVAKLAAPGFKQVARVANTDTALLGSDQTSITLLDWAKSQNRPLLPVVEALSQRNHFLQDMPWKGPAPIGHKVNWLKRSINGN